MDSTFHKDLAFSRGTRETTDLATLQAMIPGCLSVVKTGEDLDRLHIDYVANLRKGAVIHIDGKTRRKGASGWWSTRSRGRESIPNGEPDLAIEVWSVKPDRGQHGVPGWTLDEACLVQDAIRCVERNKSGRTIPQLEPRLATVTSSPGQPVAADSLPTLNDPEYVSQVLEFNARIQRGEF